MSGFDLLALFKEAALEVGNHKLDGLSMESKLADLNIKSVEVMEIVGYIEDRVKVRLSDDDLSRLATLRDLERLIEKTRSP